MNLMFRLKPKKKNFLYKQITTPLLYVDQVNTYYSLFLTLVVATSEQATIGKKKKRRQAKRQDGRADQRRPSGLARAASPEHPACRRRRLRRRSRNNFDPQKNRTSRPDLHFRRLQFTLNDPINFFCEDFSADLSALFKN